jgi:hypothetical protein
MNFDTEHSPCSVDRSQEGGGASGISDRARIDRLAPYLAQHGGLPVATIAAEFARLLDLAGPSLYLQVVASAPGATLTLQPQDSRRAMLCVANGFCCGAGQPDQLPEGGHIMVLWSRSAVHTRYEATCPTNVQQITVVANGRLISLTVEELPVTLNLTA